MSTLCGNCGSDLSDPRYASGTWTHDSEACITALCAQLALALRWGDVVDEWTEAIKAAYPTRSGSHAEYALAMQMVGNRHSKGELVALVNWLLVRGGRP